MYNLNIFLQIAIWGMHKDDIEVNKHQRHTSECQNMSRVRWPFSPGSLIRYSSKPSQEFHSIFAVSCQFAWRIRMTSVVDSVDTSGQTFLLAGRGRAGKFSGHFFFTRKIGRLKNFSEKFCYQKSFPENLPTKKISRKIFWPKNFLLGKTFRDFFGFLNFSFSGKFSGASVAHERAPKAGLKSLQYRRHTSDVWNWHGATKMLVVHCTNAVKVRLWIDGKMPSVDRAHVHRSSQCCPHFNYFIFNRSIYSVPDDSHFY